MVSNTDPTKNGDELAKGKQSIEWLTPYTYNTT